MLTQEKSESPSEHLMPKPIDALVGAGEPEQDNFGDILILVWGTELLLGKNNQLI